MHTARLSSGMLTCDYQLDQSKCQSIPAEYVRALQEVMKNGIPQDVELFEREMQQTLQRQKAQQAIRNQIQNFENETRQPPFRHMMSRLFGAQKQA